MIALDVKVEKAARTSVPKHLAADEVAELRRAAGPTPYPPGSEEKLLVLQARVSLGLPTDDARDALGPLPDLT